MRTSLSARPSVWLWKDRGSYSEPPLPSALCCGRSQKEAAILKTEPGPSPDIPAVDVLVADAPQKVGLNRFGLTRTGHLFLRTTFKCDKLAIFAIRGPFIYLTCTVNLFQCDQVYRKLHSIVKIENKNCYHWEDCLYLLWARDLPTSNRVMLVASMLWNIQVFSLQQRRRTPLEEWIKRVLSATSVDAPMFVIDLNHEK